MDSVELNTISLIVSFTKKSLWILCNRVNATSQFNAHQGTLTEGVGSVQLTSMYQLVYTGWF
jgi:hypothetical protein